MPPTRKEVIDYIANLSVEEMNDFLRELSGALGVDLSANLGNPPAPEPFTTMGVPYRDPSDLDPQYGYCGTRITLQEVGPNRMHLILVIRQTMGLSLDAARALVDQAKNGPVELGVVNDFDSSRIIQEILEVGARATSGS